MIRGYLNSSSISRMYRHVGDEKQSNFIIYKPTKQSVDANPNGTSVRPVLHRFMELSASAVNIVPAVSQTVCEIAQ